MHPRIRLLVLTTLILQMFLVQVVAASVAAAAQDPFQIVWKRVDLPVAEALVERSWIWGPRDHSLRLIEPYAEAPEGERLVLYVDKGRMELTYPGGDANLIWHVTSGLLVMELITGRLQLGNSTFEQQGPAPFNAAGDPDDPNGVTYATLASVLHASPLPSGTPITWRLNRDGLVSDDQRLGRYGVTAAYRVTVPGIDHQIAAPFWEFMNASGLVYQENEYVNAKLFQNPFYAVGYPVTEAYWTTLRVAGIEQDVLLQCFERRCLTYTPDNPEGWQVEMGNVGSHYFSWRYSEDLIEPRESLAFDSVALGAAPGGDNPGPMLVLATSDSQLSELTASLSSVDRAALESVDLTESTVVAAFHGTQSTSGYRIEIQAIAVRLDALEVKVQLVSPPPDEPVRSGFETPYHVVIVSRHHAKLDGVSEYRLIDESGSLIASGSLPQQLRPQCDGQGQ